ncbi:MAG: ATP synthase F1 subunit epsilon [Actinomycetota bacterium]|nr:ATP synthase F1 subunit epsilon [Actinomycetota bacterium]
MPLEVFVVTPERELWTGEAKMVVARGSEGEVGVMSGHAPLLIQLGIGPLFIHTEGERLAAAIDGGFLHVMSEGMDSRVDVLAENAELERDIDLNRAQQLKDEAERRLKEQDDAEAAADLAKALTRLNLRG